LSTSGAFRNEQYDKATDWLNLFINDIDYKNTTIFRLAHKKSGKKN